MNFLGGRIHRENGTDFLDLAGERVSLAPHGADGGETTVLVGVRPHDLSLESLPPRDAIVLTGRVSLLEPFGSRTDVHVVLACGEKCIISVPPHVQCKMDEEVRICANPEKLHLFGPDGVALNSSEPHPETKSP
jgi:ABC-type sugar transport system ATPase subunit